MVYFDKTPARVISDKMKEWTGSTLSAKAVCKYRANDELKREVAVAMNKSVKASSLVESAFAKGGLREEIQQVHETAQKLVGATFDGQKIVGAKVKEINDTLRVMLESIRLKGELSGDLGPKEREQQTNVQVNIPLQNMIVMPRLDQGNYNFAEINQRNAVEDEVWEGDEDLEDVRLIEGEVSEG